MTRIVKKMLDFVRNSSGQTDLEKRIISADYTTDQALGRLKYAANESINATEMLKKILQQARAA